VSDAQVGWGICAFCNEVVDHADTWVGLNPAQLGHQECALRSVLGGIGHHLAHDYWCTEHGDPDAGLTYRQSAKLVKLLVELLGVDEVSARAVAT